MHFDKAKLVQKLFETRDLSDEELRFLIENNESDERLFAFSDKKRREIYGDEVYLRGLIEFTNICKNDCLYCGIRRSNKNITRYRMSSQQILKCCELGHALGYRTFVLQGGEDSFYTDDIICEIVSAVKSSYPDCAITLSIGEKSRESYQRYYNAGAERYLLRHETASPGHYARLHPSEMSLENRKRCLFDLKEIGFQVGAGFMVGSPYQSTENIIDDLRFLQQLRPEMIGIGPFISHKDTPFSGFENGTLELTLRLLAILRLCFPFALIPSTTALGTVDPKGREKGLRAGANVIMPNLSPTEVRDKYMLYDNKICTGDNAEECRGCLERRVKAAGYSIVTSKGDARKEE